MSVHLFYVLHQIYLRNTSNGSTARRGLPCVRRRPEARTGFASSGQSHVMTSWYWYHSMPVVIFLTKLVVLELWSTDWTVFFALIHRSLKTCARWHALARTGQAWQDTGKTSESVHCTILNKLCAYQHMRHRPSACPLYRFGRLARICITNTYVRSVRMSYLFIKVWFLFPLLIICREKVKFVYNIIIIVWTKVFRL